MSFVKYKINIKVVKISNITLKIIKAIIFSLPLCFSLFLSVCARLYCAYLTSAKATSASNFFKCLPYVFIFSPSSVPFSVSKRIFSLMPSFTSSLLSRSCSMRFISLFFKLRYCFHFAPLSLRSRLFLLRGVCRRTSPRRTPSCMPLRTSSLVC